MREFSDTVFIHRLIHRQICQMIMSSSCVPDAPSTYFLLDEKDQDIYTYETLRKTQSSYIDAEKGWKVLRA